MTYETDIYNFAGWLTCRPGRMEVGSSCEAASMAEAVDEYIKKYPERFAAPQRTKPEQQPVAWYFEREGDTGISFAPDRDPSKSWQPLYTHPAPDDTALLRQVLDALCGSRLCSVNSMSSRQEAERLIDKAITALRERLGDTK